MSNRVAAAVRISDSHQIVVTFIAPTTFRCRSHLGNRHGRFHEHSGSQVTINLAGVADAQNLAVTLFNVNDGTNTSDVTIPMGVFSAIRTPIDWSIPATRCKRGIAPARPQTRSIFAPMNADGVVNSGDTLVVRAHSGDFLP